MPKKNELVRNFVVISAAVLGVLGVSERLLAADGGPTIAKDSVQVNALTLDSFKKDFDKWSWVPKIEFRVNGPIPSGSQLYLDFDIPGTGSVKFDCPTRETTKGHSWNTQCGGRDVPEEKSTQYTGKVSFAIKLRNELNNTDVSLFSGKATLAKVKSSEHGPKAANKFVFYVDDDWNLPIGYLYMTADDVRGWDLPTFHAAFWVRGDDGDFQPHLFLGAAEVGKITYQGEEVGKASCEADIEKQTSQFVDDSVPQKAKWSRIKCDFPNVRPWDKTKQPPGMFGPLYVLAKNPGAYELKVLWQNHLARSLKFTVTADGKFDNGLATANDLGDDRVITPVQILGEQDGKWNKAAWKSDAFYGNPLKGFKPAQ
jgi:hypothetical protein